MIRLFSNGGEGLANLQRIADSWCIMYNLPNVPMDFRPHVLTQWSGRKIAQEIDKLSKTWPKAAKEGDPNVDTPPRRKDLPIVLLDFGQGVYGLADGRHRVNLWRKSPERDYPVYIVEMF